jgi:hypothetical protein
VIAGQKELFFIISIDHGKGKFACGGERVRKGEEFEFGNHGKFKGEDTSLI